MKFLSKILVSLVIFFSVPVLAHAATYYPGDLNKDGKVDIADYNLLKENFGKTGSGIVGDIDNNGKVNIFDYNILVENFGNCSEACPTPMPIPSGAPVVNVTVHSKNPGKTIAPDFVGLSDEARDIVTTIFDEKNSILVQLLKNLGPGTLRLGGITLELHTFWSRTVRVPRTSPDVTVIGTDLNRLFTFAQKVGWKVILGLSFGHYDPAAAADEAEYAVTNGGSSLLALEIGNEPDTYYEFTLRPLPYTYASFRTEFEDYVQAINTRVPNAPIAGPDTCRAPTSLGWFSQFMTDKKPQVALATHHIYYLNADASPDAPKYPSIKNMLSPSLITGVTNEVDELVKLAQIQNVPLQIDETNSTGASGAAVPKAGVIDTFASALWVTDYMYNLAEHGVRGVNIHGTFNCPVIYSPICIQKNTYTIRPIYYGMLFFSQAAKGQLVPVEIQSSVNVVAHASLDSDKNLRLTLINKDITKNVAVQIKIDKSYSKANLMRLVAPSIDSTTGVTFGGSAVNSDGSWSPTVTEPVAKNGNTFQIALPAGSAAVVTFK